MKPTKVSIQEMIKPHLRNEGKGPYLTYEDAERVTDQILEVYVGVTCRYVTPIPDYEELVISSVSRRTEFFRVRIKR